jgi:beta-lactamase class A
MKKTNTTGKFFRISRRTIIFYAVFLILLSGLTIAAHIYIDKSHLHKTETVSVDNSGCPSSFTIVRENDKKLISRLYLADIETESSKYSTLKLELSRMILSYTEKGTVQTASVYCRNMNDGSWMSIDGDKLYMPGSLMKVPIMIYFLMMEQEHKGILNRELLYEKPKQNFPSQVYRGDSILSGRKYKIADLLRYMIVESDNNATHLLSKNLESDPFRKIFTDLEIPPDEINDVNYQINTKEYSKFLRVLYNATYLHRNASEEALELLAKSKFNGGISRPLPPGTIVAHKFGECGRDDDMTFSESAIIYLKNKPYLLTIMTKGSLLQDQTDLVSELSGEVFRFMSNYI